MQKNETRHLLQFNSVQSLSHVRLFMNPWIAACQASMYITNSRSLLKFISIELVMPSNHLILCSPLLLSLQSFPASRSFQMSQFFASGGHSIGVSVSASVLISASRLISFRMDWLNLLAVQGSLKSFLQHHSSKASILQCSVFVIVQLSHPYMTTGKTIALIRWTFFSKVMSLLFNMLSRLVKAFLPRSKHLLVSRLQSPSAVILEPPKIKSATLSPSISHEVMGPNVMILVFWTLSFKPTFSLSFFTFIKRLFSASLLSAIRVVSSAYLRLLILIEHLLTPYILTQTHTTDTHTHTQTQNELKI